MDASHLIVRDGFQTKRIFVAQVLLGGEGQPVDVVDALDVLGLYTQLVHLLAIEGHMLITSLYCVDESLALQLPHLFARHALNLGIVYHSVL